MIPRDLARRTARRRGQAGFTMVELIVALLAGLIVAAGIVGLSREATNSFHEEARASAAEATLRTAIDRLRADLARAGYMSTGNIYKDSMIATAPGGANVDSTAPAGIRALASIMLNDGASSTKGSVANLPSTLPPQPVTLSPDLIDIGGNMTTADQYDVAYVAVQSGSCTKIYLSPSSPAMYRLTGNGTAGAAELQAAFAPDPTSGSTKQFIMRLVDDSGRSQYLATCGGTNGTATGIDANGPWVQVDTSATGTLIRVAGGKGSSSDYSAGTESTGTVGGLSGYAAGRAWVNPVQVVQWEITSSSAATDTEPTQFTSGLALTSDGGVDPLKFDLMRSYLDATGAIVTSTSEVVAEYAVDLKFAFSVDTGTSTAPSIQTYALDDGNDNDPIAKTVTATGTMTPQRIRAVYARLAVRAALADRSVNIPVAPGNYTVNTGTQGYTYRYCIDPSAASAAVCASWARARTVTTEVALSNQARSYY